MRYKQVAWWLAALGLGLLISFAGHGQQRRQLLYGVSKGLSDRWELDDSTRRGTWVVVPYKPVYITAGRWSSNPNEQPSSENPLYSSPFIVPYNQREAKFHLSLKTKAIQGAFFGRGDVWIGYTQKAHWQVYNAALSRPFRELNYEPEVILNFPLRFKVLGLQARMAGVSFNHQSNGRMRPLSRSWNRVIFHAGLERGGFQVVVRPWIRLHDEEDENPAITDHIGRGDILLAQRWRRHQFSIVATHSLRFDERNRGYIVGSWTFPVWGNFRGQLQVGEGYGETMIDYNHRQAIVGLGVSLIDW